MIKITLLSLSCLLPFVGFAQNLKALHLDAAVIETLQKKYGSEIKDLSALNQWANEISDFNFEPLSANTRFLAQENLRFVKADQGPTLQFHILIQAYFAKINDLEAKVLAEKNAQYLGQLLDEVGKKIGIRFEFVVDFSYKKKPSEMIYAHPNDGASALSQIPPFTIAVITESDSFWLTAPAGARTYSDYVGNRIAPGERFSAVFLGSDFLEPIVFAHEFTHWALLNADAYPDPTIGSAGYPALKTFCAFTGTECRAFHPLEVAIALARFGIDLDMEEEGNEVSNDDTIKETIIQRLNNGPYRHPIVDLTKNADGFWDGFVESTKSSTDQDEKRRNGNFELISAAGCDVLPVDWYEYWITRMIELYRESRLELEKESVWKEKAPIRVHNFACIVEAKKQNIELDPKSCKSLTFDKDLKCPAQQRP